MTSENPFASFDHIFHPVYVLKPSGIFTFVNESFSNLFGYNNDDLVGREKIHLLFPSSLHSRLDERLERRTYGIEDSYQARLIKKNGSGVDVLLGVKPVFERNQHMYNVANLTDITNNVKLERKLRSERNEWRTLMETIPDGLVYMTPDGHILKVNRALELLTGKKPHELEGMHVSDFLINEQDLFKAREMLSNGEAGDIGKVQEYETVINISGVELPISTSIGRVLTASRKHIGTWARIQNISTRKKLELELERRSITDGLTGLYNQDHFKNVLSHEVARAKRHREKLSLILMDLNNFKLYNDQIGHDAGDVILREIGKYLLESSRDSDYSAFRSGIGDEFTCLLPNTGISGAEIFFHRIKNGFTRFNFHQRYNINSRGEKVSLAPLTFSAGIVELGKDESAEDFRIRGDRAMYEAKDMDKSLHNYVVGKFEG